MIFPSLKMVVLPRKPSTVPVSLQPPLVSTVQVPIGR